MTRTRIKICGLTREEDVDAAVDAGADAIGMVFYPPSPRALTVAHAAMLRKRVPPFVDVVALFVNASSEDIEKVRGEVGPELLQFHGDEPEADCVRFGQRYLRAFRVGAPGLDTAAGLLESCEAFGSAAGWLFDSHSDGYGGSGRTFDWSLVSSASARPVVLSGGLHASNVAQAIQAVRPTAVDVSSGVESARGIKSAERIRDFITEVRRADDALR